MRLIYPVIYFEVSSYSLLATIGVCGAVLFFYFRMDRVNVTFRQLLVYLILCAVFAVVCARTLFLITMLPQQEMTWEDIVNYALNGGIVFYGGLFGVLTGLLTGARIFHHPAQEIMDLAAPSFPLFHFFGRIGCLLSGCCYGIPWSWGVRMADSPDIIRFPVQLTEAGANLVIFVWICIKERRRGSTDGNLRFYMVTYAGIRFVLEFFRGDTIRGIWFWGLSTAQLISAGILLCFGINSTRIYLIKKAEKKGRPGKRVV